MKEIRKYFRTKVKECLSGYKIIDDPTGDNDLANTTIDKHFKVIIGNLVHDKNHQSFTDLIPVSVELYKKGNQDMSAVFDSIYDDGIAVRNACISPASFDGQFEEVLNIGFVAEELDTNDKAIKITIQFQIRKDFLF